MLQKNKNKSKKKIVRIDPVGRAYIVATYNNVIITITNQMGQTIEWSSSGKVGFKGSKKNTPYAASVAAADCAKAAYDLGVREVIVYLKGIGVGRESAIRSIADNRIVINTINDVTPVPHNGCRPPKRRKT